MNLLMPETSWFFDSAEAVQRLRSAAAAGAETPWRPFSRVIGRGGGTDCVGWIEHLFTAAGAVRALSFPRTKADYSRHVHNDRILDYLRGKNHCDSQSAYLAERFAEFPIVERGFEVPALIGDLIILRTGVGLYHMPVMLDARLFTHCAAPFGVSEGDIGAPNYRDHLVAHFRARAL